MELFKCRVRIDVKDRTLGLSISSRLQEMDVYANIGKETDKNDDMALFMEGYRINVTDDVNSDYYFGVQNIIIVDDNFQTDDIIYHNEVLFLNKRMNVNSICNIVKFHCNYGTSKKKAEQSASMILLEAGIQPSLRGYTYLKDAIVNAALRPKLYSAYGNASLCEYVAAVHDINPTAVEKGIRDAINAAYYKNSQRLLRMFKYSVGRPITSDIISVAVERIRNWVL